MSYEYEEVVNLVLKTTEFNVALNRAEAMFGRAKGTFDKLAIVEMRVADKTLKFDLDRAYKNVLNSIDAQTKAEVAGRTKALKISADIAAQFRKADDKDSLTSIRAIEKQRLDEAKALHSYRREMDRATARAEREEARALHRYRMEMDKERAQAQAQLAKQSLQFGNIFAPGGRPLAITPNAPVAPSGLNASAALRAGAGAAGALGAYPAAGALYATANAMQFLGKSTISATAALAVFGPALAAIGGAFVAYKFVEWGAEFSRELARMSTLMLSTKASAGEFAAALDRTAVSALKVSSAFNMEAVDVIKAFKDALSSGIDVADLERFTTIAANLASATASSIGDATNLLTSIKDTYHLSVGEMSAQSDKIFNAINVGKIQLSHYAAGFSKVAEAGKGAGIKIDELHEAIIVLGRGGMAPAKVMTTMVALIHGLTNPSEKAQKALNGMGIEFGGAAFRGKSFLEVIEKIKAKTQGGVGSLIGNIFDDERARQAARGLTSGTALWVNEAKPGVAEVETTAVAASRAMNNLTDDIGKMMKTMSNAVTKKSHGVGTWLDGIFFGTPEEKAETEKKTKETFDKMMIYAQSAIDRGQGSDIARRNIFSVVKPDVEGLSMGDNIAVTTRHMAMIEVAIETAYGRSKDKAVESIRNIREEVIETTRDTIKLLDTIAKPVELFELSKLSTKQLNARATDEQKQAILDLQEQLEDENNLLAAKKEQLAIDVESRRLAFEEKNIVPVANELDKVMREGGDKEAIPGLTAKLATAKKEFEEFSKSIKEELTNTTAFTPFLLKISELALAIAEMRSRISTQDTTKNVASKKRAVEEANDAAKKEIEEFNTVAERLYKEDLTAYERAQKARVKVFKDADDRIQDQAKRGAEIQTTIANNILKANLDDRSDDPAAQARIARAERDTALEDLKSAAKGGDRNKFESAMGRYQAASESARDGTNQIDKRRGNRLYRDDQMALSKLSSEFDESFAAGETQRTNMISRRDNAVAVRSPQQIAKDAAKEVAANKEITKVVLDAQVKLQIDGTLSEKTKLELVTLITDKVKQGQKNNNPPPSTYDSKTRNNRSPVSIDE